MNSMKNLTDEELVSMYARGGNEAFDQLLERHKGKIFSYISFAVKDKEVANDIFQDTFLKAILTIRQNRYTEHGKFSAWLMRIAHNLIIDYFRQEKNNVRASCDEEGSNLLNDMKYSEATIEEKIISHQIHADVKRLIQFLPSSQQDVIIMRFYKNLSFKEIAKATGVSINTALGRMRYALLNLRKMADEKQMILTLD